MKPKRIAIMIELTRSFSRDLIKSIAREARKKYGWQLLLHEHQQEQGVPEWLESWEGDGLLVRIHNRELADFLHQAPYPVVNVAGVWKDDTIPHVEADEDEMMVSVIRFFLDRAFSLFAYCGYSGVEYSDVRQQAFLRAVSKLNLEPQVYAVSTDRSIEEMSRREKFHPEGSPKLKEWVAGLEKHTAIISCNDVRAFQLQLSAVSAERKIPEDLAVIGVGNESVVSAFCDPPLSSVRMDAERMAATACLWLHAMMEGMASSEDVVVKFPTAAQKARVVERASTDVIATQDAVLIQVLRYIRSQCHQPINAADVLQHVGKSRNTVEGKMRSQLGHTIAHEILRCRIERAKVLIEHTSMAMEHIAPSCGFVTAAHFARKFKQVTGLSPAAYREVF